MFKLIDKKIFLILHLFHFVPYLVLCYISRDHSRIVPFRESKLTRLFQNFFVGRGKAAMIVNVNQCASMFDETLHVFKFSAIASQVGNLLCITFYLVKIRHKSMINYSVHSRGGHGAIGPLLDQMAPC